MASASARKGMMMTGSEPDETGDDEKEDSYNDSKENKQEEEIIESESVPPSRRFQTSFSTPPL